MRSDVNPFNIKLVKGKNLKYIKDAPAGKTALTMFRSVKRRERILYILHWVSGGLLALVEVFGLSLIAGLLLLQSISQALWLIVVYSISIGLLRLIMTQSDVIAYTPLNNIRGDYFLKTLFATTTMDLKYFEDPVFQDEKDTAEEATRTNEAGLEGIYHRLFPLGADLFAWLALGSVMATLRWWLFPLSLLPIVLYILIAEEVVRRQNVRRTERQSVQRQVSTYAWVSSDFRYGKDVRLYHLKDALLEYFAREIERLKRILEWHYRIDSWGYGLSFVAIVLIDGLILYLLVQSRFAGMPLERFILYLGTMTTMSLAMLRLSQSISFVMTEFRLVRRYFGFVEANWSSASDENQQTLSEAPSIRFEDVSFAYPNTDKTVIDRVSFTIDAGERIALVGINGAGKTTLMKLLMGLYRPDQGRILINGIDYHQYSAADLRQMFAVVFQEVEPLAVSIAQHVSCQYDGFDYPRIQRALERAGIWEKVASLDKQMDSMLLKVVDEEGVIFSGGENQKLMIARALYREDAKIMVMDEPTAALDALAEAAIYRDFDQLMEGLTGIFISHRLASTQFCDEIILLDGGRVLERGTHQELLATGGVYSQMYQTQKKYYQEDADETV